MKTFFTLLLSTLFTLSSFAYDGARLTISSISSTKMFVEVNGRRYNMDGNTITIRDLRSGYHTIRIFREVKRKGNRWWDFGFGNNRRQESIYDSRIYLKDRYHFDIVVNRFGKVLVDERRVDRNDDWYNEDDDDDDRDSDRRQNRDRDRDNRDRDYDNGYGRTISNRDFDQAKETLKKEWFENTRVTTAKQVIDGNNFTASQVKELLQLFTFEDNKLELAKYAYRKTVDKNNYYIINDVFTFSKSKEELARYIRDFR